MAFSPETYALLKGQGGGGGSSEPLILTVDIIRAEDDFAGDQYEYSLNITAPSAHDVLSAVSNGRTIKANVQTAYGQDTRIMCDCSYTTSDGTLSSLYIDTEKISFVNCRKLEGISKAYFRYFSAAFILIRTLSIYSRYIVYCLPTAQDYSGVMDCTIDEISQIFNLGAAIYFRLIIGANTALDTIVTGIYNGGLAYPSFNAYALEDASNLLIYAFTGATSDGSGNSYYTTIYPLTPLQ